MSCAWTATQLDARMLRKSVASNDVPLDLLPLRTGEEVAQELAGRALLRYVDDRNVHETGHAGPTFVTPTPYSVEDLHGYLALPGPRAMRTHVLWLDPTRLTAIRGPRWCDLGSGIEYILTKGYSSEAILSPGWAVEIR
jgi:hypothetical protein